MRPLTLPRIARELVPPTEAELNELDRKRRKELCAQFEILYSKFRLKKRDKRGRSVPRGLVRVLARYEAYNAGIDPDVLFTRSRLRTVARARWRVMRRLRKYGYPLEAIGDALGLDHTSVLHGIRRLEECEQCH